MLKLFYFQDEFTDVILVTRNGFSIALAESTEKRQESLVLLGVTTVLHDVFDCLIVNLLVQQLLVVLGQLIDGTVSHQVVILVCHHALMKEMGNPLGDVKLILNALLGTKLKNTVNQLANTNDR
jgi:hypothetical protein